MEMNVEERRGRPKKKWLNAIECDTRVTCARVNDVGYRVRWRLRSTKVADPK